MTTFDEMDEIASAYVDGEATADDISRVESSAELQALVAEFRSVRDGVAQPVAPLDEATREAMIARALGATAPEAAPIAGASAGADGAVTSIDTARRSRLDAADHVARRQRRDARRSRLMSVAAAFLIVAVGGGVAWGVLNSSNSTTTETADASAAIDSATDAVDGDGDAMGDAETSGATAHTSGDNAPSPVAQSRSDDSVAESMVAESTAASADEAMEDDADDEAMAEDTSADDAMEEAAEEDAMADAGDAAPADAAAGNAPMTLRQQLASGAFQLWSLDGPTDPGALNRLDPAKSGPGLFEVDFDERSDFIGDFETSGDLAAAAELAARLQPGAETTLIQGNTCDSLIPRLLDQRPVTIAGTATLGPDLDRVVVIQTGAGELVGLEITGCAIVFGAGALDN